MASQRGGTARRSPSGTVLRVRLLGGVAIELDGELVELDSARAESLLAYLLLHRDAPQQRRHLAFTLWPDSTEQQARTNLRHVLHNLRRELPDADRFIDAGARTLRWAPDAALWLDVDEFERALSDGRLDDAIGIYRGDLLEGAYDEWLLEERERLAQLHLEALEALARELEDKGRPGEAVRHAERLLSRDPLREDAYRLLMRLHDAAGDRARALRTYHLCATTLVRELGVEPSAATRADYDALLAAEPAAASDAGAPAGPAPLVGRREERARLAALWRSAEGGGAGVGLVTGEPGIGKSRLVEELRSWCSHRGAVTAEARAYAAEGEIAYGGLAAWLRSEPIRTRLGQLEPAHVAELARLAPELATIAPGLPAAGPLPPDEQRLRLFAAAAAALLAPGSPVLLIADDVQWCDVQTLQFVHYLLRAEPDARLLVAATARGTELADRPAVGELLTALSELGAVTEVPLGRLDRDEVVALAERVVGRPLGAGEADRLDQESEGNPLFLLEALRAEPGAGAAGELSERVRALIAARLARLSEATSELAGVAAAIGRDFTAPLLAAAAGADEGRLVRGLDELWRAGIIRAHGPAAYDFSHGRIRDVAYGLLGPASARHHHLRIAEALERTGGDGTAATSGARIAAQYEAAGADLDAVRWYRQAAIQAQRVAASDEAVRSLERALGLIRRLEPGYERDALELEVLTSLPAPLVAIEGYLSDRVGELHARALELVRDLGVEPEAPLDRSLALATLTRGEFEAARPYGERLRAHAEDDGDDVLWVESAYVLALASYWQGRLEDARREFEAALARYRPEHRADHLLRYGQDPQVFCRMRLAHTLWLLGDEEGSERARSEALASALEVRHPYSRGGALVFAIILALDQGNEERIRRHTEELNAEEAVLRARPMRSGAAAFAGYVDVLDGRVDPGVERIQDAFADARDGRAAAPGHLGFLARLLVEALARTDRSAAGAETARDALALGGGTELWKAEILRLRAGMLAAHGAPPAEVGAELEKAVEVAIRQGAASFARRAQADLERLRGGG